MRQGKETDKVGMFAPRRDSVNQDRDYSRSREKMFPEETVVANEARHLETEKTVELVRSAQ